MTNGNKKRKISVLHEPMKRKYVIPSTNAAYTYRPYVDKKFVLINSDGPFDIPCMFVVSLDL